MIYFEKKDKPLFKGSNKKKKLKKNFLNEFLFYQRADGTRMFPFYFFNRAEGAARRPRNVGDTRVSARGPKLR